MLREEAVREIIGYQQRQTADAPFALHLTRQGVEPVEFEDQALSEFLLRSCGHSSGVEVKTVALIGDFLWLRGCPGFAMAREA